MLIPLKDVLNLYETIQQEMNISQLSVVMFAGVDADSLCTLKILTKLFRCENIQYKIYPTNSYQELEVRIDECKSYQKVKLFFFINCGGILDLTSYWFGQSDTTKIFLMDVNKPIHHKNIQSHQIVLINDEESNLHNCPTTEEIQKYEELNEYDLQEEQQEIDDNSSDDDEVVSSPKRKNQKNYKQQLRKHKQLIQDKINNYYGKQFFSLPSSYSAYRMVRDLKKGNNQFLWYAIVGYTGMFLQQKISKESFDKLSQYYQSEVTRYNLQNLKKEKGQISVKKDYQFTLMSHWSLYQSMMNSHYLIVKMALWEDKGVNKLHQMLTELGISLVQAKQQFKFMPAISQNKLDQNIFRVAQKFRLLEVAFLSFSKQVDSYCSFTASDFHYIITSILQKPSDLKMSHEALCDMRLLNFWEAFEIFEQNVEYLYLRIQQYKKISLLLAKEARSLMERDQIIVMKEISYVNIRNQSQENKIFEHPLTLMKLAYLLMGIQKEKKGSKYYKPLVASLQNSDQCLIVGVVMEAKNEMGKKFNEVADLLTIDVKQDGFQSNIMIIPKDALLSFVKKIGIC